MSLHFDPAQYFQRQSIVHGYGNGSLVKLRDARVGVVGCGGVGSAIADYLARSGIGHLQLIDQDIVDHTNLPRVHCVGTRDLYRSKAEAVAENLVKEHPWLDASPVVETIRADNVDELLKASDIILDGLDNFRTRYLLNGFSVRTGTPYIFTSAIANQAHTTIFHPPETPCLECVFPSVAPASGQSCENLGVTAPIVGLIATIAASETVRHVLGQESRLKGEMLTVDLASPDFILSRVSKRSDCSRCKGRAHEPEVLADCDVLCGENIASITPSLRMTLDLTETARFLSGNTRLLSVSDRVLVYEEEGSTVSIFKNGRIIVRGVSSETRVRTIAGIVWRHAAPDPNHSQPIIS